MNIFVVLRIYRATLSRSLRCAVWMRPQPPAP